MTSMWAQTLLCQLIPFLLAIQVLGNVNQRPLLGGCQTTPDVCPGTTQNITLGARSYLLHVPENYNENNPTGVIFSYHGRLKNASEQQDLSQLSNEVWNPDMLAIYPQGIKNKWEGAPYTPASHHDLEFTTDILQNVKSGYCVDDSRIYASGMSNGGGFVDLLACSKVHGGHFAAFAMVSGAFYDDIPVNTKCNPARPTLPILEFHGLNTTHVPYYGGNASSKSSDQVPSIPAWLLQWADRNGCPSPITNTTGLYNGTDDVYVATYPCNVQGYRIDSMGHSWPSIANGTAPIDATPLIVDFFNNNPKPSAS